MITKENIADFHFDEYKKIQLTSISRERLIIGTKILTLEGEYICAEISRLAKDINGNIYPIAESVFKKIYQLL